MSLGLSSAYNTYILNDIMAAMDAEFDEFYSCRISEVG